MERILIFSVSIGAGHDLAAKAVVQEVENRYPNCKTKVVDTFKYINNVLNKVIVGSYMESLKFNPKIWGYLYEQAENDEKFVDLRQLLSNLLSVKMERLIENFEPQAIICTHAFPAGILSILKGKGKVTVPVTAIMTDYTVHPFWIHQHLDSYVLPSQELVYEIMSYGVPEEKLLPFGIPIRSQFKLKYDKAEARKNLDLENIPTILVMGGGLGLGEIENIIRTLGYADIGLQVISVTGKNDRLWAKLQNISAKNKIKIFGFVENMAEIMAASDFIITKPGGLTTAEVLSQGLPMIIVNPLPGQEHRNTDYLLNNGVAIKVRKIEHLVPQLKNLMKNNLRLMQMNEMASLIGKPNAASDFVDYLEKIIN